MSASPKSGQVVDASSGEGIEGAFVFATAVFSAGPVFHSSVAEGLYHDVTRTDHDGNYFLPMNPHALRVGVPGTDAHYRWLITVFKPGYALSGDEVAWKAYNPDGSAHFVPLSLVKPPRAYWVGWTRVAPLALQKQDLSAVDWALYWQQLLYTDLPELWDDDTERSVRREAAEWIVPRLCAMGEEKTLGYPVTSVIISFAADPAASSRKLADLEPLFADMLRREQIQYKPRDICQAMKDIGAQHVD